MSCVVEDIYKYDYPKTTSLISYNSYNPIYITSDYDSGIFSWVENIPTKEGFNVLLIYIYRFIYLIYQKDFQYHFYLILIILIHILIHKYVIIVYFMKHMKKVQVNHIFICIHLKK